ncbi:MAG: hypothetical protein J5966_08605, partial [Lachnospiraceae bacterium]|nr:hypothetical protein [Lachnospiraceae bacterium]
QGATDPNFTKHTNNVTLTANGQAITDSATAIVSHQTVTKTAEKIGTRKVGDVDLPVYKYSIVLENVSSDVNVVEDKYDKNLLEPYVYNSWDAWYVFGGGIWSQDTRGGQFVHTETQEGMRFETSASNMPHDPSSSTGFYPKYKLVYYLTVKDEAALNTILQRAAANEGGIYKLENTAKWGDSTSTGEVTYEYQGLDKKILTSDEDLKKIDQDVYADFEITLNPAAQEINGGQPLTMTDTVENLSVVITSITAVPSEGVTFDMSGNTVTYTIPDATKIVITYRARVLFDKEPSTGQTSTIKFKNTAEMKGYRDHVEGEAEKKNTGSGGASLYSINLMKYEAGNMQHRLAGAVFALLDADDNPIIERVQTDEGIVEREVQYTTNENGMIEVFGSMSEHGWALYPDTRYRLKEIVAPPGYMLADFVYDFTISRDGHTDYSKYIFHSGDTMSAKNYPGTDINVKKYWKNEAGDEVDPPEDTTIEVKLQQKIGDGEFSDTIREEVKQTDGSYHWQDTEGKTLTLSAENDWEDWFNKLPKTVPTGDDFDGEDVSVEY